VLAKQFGNPPDGTQKAKQKVVESYLSRTERLRVLSNVDNNYATDKETWKETIVNWL
jgi:hypothetical protein